MRGQHRLSRADRDLQIERAAITIAAADHLLITAGAGMGVDSGLPDYRGSEGFWNAHPPLREQRLRWIDLAQPDAFRTMPALAWGFYGSRLALYRGTQPHDGFRILRRWAATKQSFFVYTSNVDGQFQRAGFPPECILEIHGSLHHTQCLTPCHPEVHDASGLEILVDPDTLHATSRLPRCPRCSGMARPNVLLFGDDGFVRTRRNEQRRWFVRWLSAALLGRLVIVELGAGSSIPIVRHEGEMLARRTNVRLVRINLYEPESPAGVISIPGPALDTTRIINEILVSSLHRTTAFEPPARADCRAVV